MEFPANSCLNKREILTVDQHHLCLFEDMPELEQSLASAMAATNSDADALLAQEMNNLSVNERIQALEDIHGVSMAEEEKEYIIAIKLKELDLAIGRNKSSSYLLAESLSKDYVEDRDLRLMFLRADMFNVELAAKRIMSFFDNKLRYFGEEKLVKQITLDDLDEDDLECLQSGAFQEVAEKDRAGRAILVGFPQLRTFKRQQNLVSQPSLKRKRWGDSNTICKLMLSCSTCMI